MQVQDSLDRYDSARAEVSNEEVDFAVNQVILKSMTEVGTVLKTGLRAKISENIHIGKDKEGKDKYRRVTRPDTTTQLKTIDTMKNLMDSIRPKGGGIAITSNTQVNNPGSGTPGGRPQGLSFEDRVRRNRQRKIDEGEVVDAEVIEEQTLEEELSDIGIDIEDDEEGDDDDIQEG